MKVNYIMTKHGLHEHYLVELVGASLITIIAIKLVVIVM